LFQLVNDGERGLRQLLVAAAGDGELQTAAGIADVQAVRLEGKGAHTRHLARALVHLVEDLLLRAFTLVPGRKTQDQEGAVAAALTDDGERGPDLAAVDHRLEGSFDLLELACHIVEADTLRRSDAHHRSRTVFV